MAAPVKTDSTGLGLPMATIIHAGVEVVVMAGLAYWIHSKTSGLQEQITLLIEKVKAQEELLKKQNEILAHHENALNQFHTILQGLTDPKAQQPRRSIPQQRTKQPQQSRAPVPPRKPVKKPISSSNNRPEKRPIPPIKNKKPTNKTTKISQNDEDLDTLLEDEIGELTGSQDNDNGSRVICDDDECYVEYNEDNDDEDDEDEDNNRYSKKK